jgi:hypothetical protein
MMRRSSGDEVLIDEDGYGAKIGFGGRYNFAGGGDFTVGIGNVVIGTAGKGIDFSANGGDVLTQYDEGTWTPNQGAGLTVVGAFSSSGTFTRVGRQVTVRGIVAGATSVAIEAAASQICTNLPFAAAGGHCGTMINDGLNASGAVAASASILFAAGTMGATPSIFFTVTYQI